MLYNGAAECSGLLCLPPFLRGLPRLRCVPPQTLNPILQARHPFELDPADAAAQQLAQQMVLNQYSPPAPQAKAPMDARAGLKKNDFVDSHGPARKRPEEMPVAGKPQNMNRCEIRQSMLGRHQVSVFMAFKYPHSAHIRLDYYTLEHTSRRLTSLSPDISCYVDQYPLSPCWYLQSL